MNTSAAKHLDQEFLASLPHDLPIDKANQRLSAHRAQRARRWDKWEPLLNDDEFEAFLATRDYQLLCVQGACDAAHDAMKPVEIEQCAIGAMLIARDSPQWRDKALHAALSRLHAKHFALASHRLIFIAICELERARQVQASEIEEICVSAVAHKLRQRHQLEAIGGAAYLTASMQLCDSVLNLKFYIRAIVDASRLRHSYELGHELIARAVQPDASAARIAAFAQNSTAQIAESGWCDFGALWNATQK